MAPCAVHTVEATLRFDCLFSQFIALCFTEFIAANSSHLYHRSSDGVRARAVCRRHAPAGASWRTCSAIIARILHSKRLDLLPELCNFVVCFYPDARSATVVLDVTEYSKGHVVGRPLTWPLLQQLLAVLPTTGSVHTVNDRV